MEEYLLGGFGIFVSVALFLIGYRQTIGAKKERVIAANSEIEKIILRRVVLENYDPTVTDLSRFLEGKARDFRVKINDLLSEGQILNCIFTRIIETDLIAQDKREEILNRLINILEEVENTPISESSVIDLNTTSKSQTFYKFSIPLTMAFVASIMGSIITLIPQAKSNSLNLSSMSEIMSVTIAMSMTMIMALYMYKKLKESQQDVDIPSRSKSIEKAIEFEREVAKVIDKYGIKYKASGPQDQGYDFEIILNDKPVLIEVKAWTRPAPMQLITRIVHRLAEYVDKGNAQKGLIISKVPINIKNIEVSADIEAMSLSEFNKYLHDYR